MAYYTQAYRICMCVCMYAFMYGMYLCSLVVSEVLSIQTRSMTQKTNARQKVYAGAHRGPCNSIYKYTLDILSVKQQYS